MHVELEHVIEDGETLDDEEDAAVVEEAEATASVPTAEDDGRDAHDEAVSNTMRGEAIRIMAAKGITIADAEKKVALQLFPRVSLLSSHTYFKILIARIGVWVRATSPRCHHSKREV